jgi:hypothetical protein
LRAREERNQHFPFVLANAAEYHIELFSSAVSFSNKVIEKRFFMPFVNDLYAMDL